jgi:hypothetical protein
MKFVRLSYTLLLALALVPRSVIAHTDDFDSKSGRLGRVLFKTSCTPDAQQELQLALAMMQ